MSFAQHLIRNDHNNVKMENMRKLVYKKRKSRHLDIMEKYYIFKETKKGTQVNDKKMIMKNSL